MIPQSPIGKASCSSVGIGRLGLRLLLLGALLCGLPHPAPAQPIVLAPPTGLPGPDPVHRQDFLRLFVAPAEWPVTVVHTSTMGFTDYYVTHAQPDELNHVLGFVASHHLALDVALQALPADGCGRGIEGIVGSTYAPMLAVHRLQELGAKVGEFALDEPLTFGFSYRGKNQCAYPIAEVARRLAMTIRAVREVYPNAKIVDAEAATNYPTAQWLTILAEWLSAYRAATGTPLDEISLDMAWHQPYWLAEAAATVNFAHSHGTKVELIINAQGDLRATDAEWLALSQRNMQDIWRARIPFDGVVFATWNKRPTRVLPESDPLSLTGLIAWYIRYRP
jgi:hypothetical protein